MGNLGSATAMAAAWNRASAAYLARRDDVARIVTYGALAPDEEILGLLGDVSGLRVIDFGCGGGHNAVACARAGANVTGIDISGYQLAFARKLAEREGVSIRWVHGGVEQLGALDRADLILAVHVFSYIADLAGVFAACHGALANGGRLVVTVDHPIRTCFWDADAEDVGPVALRSYADETPTWWRFDESTPMQSFPHMTQTWIDVAAAHGLRLTRMVEPLAPVEMRNMLWPEDSHLAPLREIPHTLIMIFALA